MRCLESQPSPFRILREKDISLRPSRVPTKKRPVAKRCYSQALIAIGGSLDCGPLSFCGPTRRPTVFE
jgi:hypothetical protein